MLEKYRLINGRLDLEFLRLPLPAVLLKYQRFLYVQQSTGYMLKYYYETIVNKAVRLNMK